MKSGKRRSPANATPASDIVFARRFRKPARRAANLEGGVGGERDVLKELHFAIKVYQEACRLCTGGTRVESLQSEQSI